MLGQIEQGIHYGIAPDKESSSLVDLNCGGALQLP